MINKTPAVFAYAVFVFAVFVYAVFAFVVFVACARPAEVYDASVVRPKPRACYGYMSYPQMTFAGPFDEGNYNFSLHLLQPNSHRVINFHRGEISNPELARSTGLISEVATDAQVYLHRSHRGYCTKGVIDGDLCLVQIWARHSCWLLPAGD